MPIQLRADTFPLNVKLQLAAQHVPMDIKKQEVFCQIELNP